jgi:uncharacterized cofD-like protein
MKILLATADDALARFVTESLARFRYEIVRAGEGLSAFQCVLRESFDLALVDQALPPSSGMDLLDRVRTISAAELPATVVFVRSEHQREQVEARGLPRVEVLAMPAPPRILVDRIVRLLRERPRVVCMGGGTGLFTLLSGLKTLPGVSLTAVVSMSDDGGSTGRLRDGFGVLPPGDVRRSLIALSSAPDLLNELMGFRFSRGGELSGHSLGNLILTALSEMRGSMGAAVRALGEILQIHGRVIPVTEGRTTLKARLATGEVIVGERRIDHREEAGDRARIERLWCDPAVPASREALAAIAEADLVVLGPGDLFTSVIANLVVDGVSDALRASRARRLYVLNVMTEPEETPGFSVVDHVREVVRYLGGDRLDHVLCSTTRFSPSCVARYSARGQRPVKERPGESLASVTAARVHRADVASDTVLVRHDSLKLARALRPLIESVPAADSLVRK